VRLSNSAEQRLILSRTRQANTNRCSSRLILYRAHAVEVSYEGESQEYRRFVGDTGSPRRPQGIAWKSSETDWVEFLDTTAAIAPRVLAGACAIGIDPVENGPTEIIADHRLIDSATLTVGCEAEAEVLRSQGPRLRGHARASGVRR
jgi:hypothetical protein